MNVDKGMAPNGCTGNTGRTAPGKEVEIKGDGKTGCTAAEGKFGTMAGTAPNIGVARNCLFVDFLRG